MTDVPITPVTIEEKLKSITREISLRLAVYPIQVGKRAMTQEKADREILIMKAILDDYLAIAKKT